MWKFISAVACLSMGLSAQTAAGIEFFEAKIRPVLAKNCFVCHSHEGKVSRGGLVLDTKSGPLAGGDSGAAIVPGDVDASILIQAIRQTGRRKMPPGGKLPEAVIADFEKWVTMGAPDPRDTATVSKAPVINWEIARKFWAFVPVAPVAPPKPRDFKWAATPIDQFVMRSWKRRN